MKRIILLVLDIVIIIVFPLLNILKGRALLEITNWGEEICNLVFCGIFVVAIVYFITRIYWWIFVNGKKQLKEENEKFEEYQDLGTRIKYCEIFLKQFEEYRISIENASIKENQENKEYEDNVNEIREMRLELIKSLARITKEDIEWKDLHKVRNEKEGGEKEKKEKSEQINSVQEFIYFIGNVDNIKENSQDIDKLHDKVVFMMQRQVLKWEKEMKENNLGKSSLSAKIAAFLGLL